MADNLFMSMRKRVRNARPQKEGTQSSNPILVQPNIPHGNTDAPHKYFGFIAVAVGGILTFIALRKLLFKKEKRTSSPISTTMAQHRPLMTTPHGSPKVSSPRQTNTTVSQWQRLEELGRGTYGKVFRGTHRTTGEFVAIKEMHNPAACAELKKEFDFLQKLSHPHVVQIRALEVNQASGRMRLVLEWCSGSSLSALVSKYGAITEESRLKIYAREMLLGLAYLHENGILHRDVKPANVLLDSEGNLKLTDFGLSRHMESMGEKTGLAGTPVYLSPEAARGEFPKDEASKGAADVWAVGATLVHVATATVPWTHVRSRQLDNPIALIGYIGTPPKDATDHHPKIPDFLSSEGKAFFKQLFMLDPAKRGTCQLLLSTHPFLLVHGTDPVTVDNLKADAGGSNDDDDNDAGAAAMGAPLSTRSSSDSFEASDSTAVTPLPNRTNLQSSDGSC